MATKAEKTAKKTTKKTTTRKATTTGKKLVIVESPSKAKTIEKMLGSTYKVVASVGHVRDLPKSKLGIDVENDFEPNYISIRGKGDVIKALRKEAKKASKIYLATDPDREGEAISWHLAYLLGIDETSECRVTFNEITKNTVKEAIKNPRRIDLNLVDAQQARRVLDRLVGYQISPLLWRKIKRGLSAGRVQSAALKIICDREREINAFDPEEYWTVSAEFEKKRKKFSASLVEYDGQKIVTGKDLGEKKDEAGAAKGKRLRITSDRQAEEILKGIDRDGFTVLKVTEKEKKTRPQPPFTTSSMQQAASTRINFAPKKTMKVAQELYEGVTIKGKGTVGLITYMRTDSVRISEEARANAKAMIAAEFGEEYVGNGYFTNGKKEVQDAHEAIRPSYPELRPEDIRDSLTNDQFKLYNLIWSRFMASQMASAVYDGVNADIANGKCLFRAVGSKVKFEGYLKVYNNSTEAEKKSMLPALEEGENLKNTSIEKEQHFTQPPSRFTEASLVKELEQRQIGRPSTYAPIVGTLTERRYVKREKKTLFPTDLGMTVDGMMEEYFKDIVNAEFTADMEKKLDSVEEGEIRWRKVVGDFYGPFSEELKFADNAIEKVEVEDEEIGRDCPECGRPLVRKQGRFGEFIACKGYPECNHTEAIVYSLGVQCPSCGKDLVQRRSRRGKIFYGCSGYPDCNMVFWYKPVNRKCPDCGSILLERVTKSGKKYVCSSEECRYSEQAEEDKNE